MPDTSTAEIIPFPSRAITPVAVDPLVQSSAPAQLTATPMTQVEPSPAEARLTRALNGLNNAVTAQRAAMAARRSALGDLRTVTGRLGASLRTYNDSLGHLDARVQTLRTEAIKLEAWADDALAKKG